MIFSSVAAGKNSNESRRTPSRIALAFIAATVGSGALAATPGAATQAAAPATAAPAHAAPAPAPQPLDPSAAARFAGLALSCLHKEYPNKIAHVMESDADALPPHTLTPAFYGCFDWHSDVHGHWLLVRLLRLFPNAPFANDVRTSLAASLTPKNIAGEVDYIKSDARAE